MLIISKSYFERETLKFVAVWWDLLLLQEIQN